MSQASQLRAQLISAAGADNIADALGKFEHMASGDGTNASAAAHNVALAYQSGAASEDDTVDLQSAKKWFERCLELGRDNSLLPLVQVQMELANNDAVELRKVLAVLAKADGAQLDTGIQYHNLAVTCGNSGDASLSDIAYEAALKASEKGFLASQPILISALMEGQGCAKDLKTAATWLEKFSAHDPEQNKQQVCLLNFNLSICFTEDQQPDKAFPCVKLAAEHGYDQAYSQLSMAYLNGTGTGKDEKLGLEWMAKAAESGDVLAAYNLGVIHEHGMHGNPCSDKNAFKWYLKAGEQDQKDGAFQTGTFFAYGRGGQSQDKAQALKWLEKAHNLGHDKAKDLINKLNAGTIQQSVETDAQALLDKVNQIQAETAQQKQQEAVAKAQEEAKRQEAQKEAASAADAAAAQKEAAPTSAPKQPEAAKTQEANTASSSDAGEAPTINFSSEAEVKKAEAAQDAINDAIQAIEIIDLGAIDLSNFAPQIKILQAAILQAKDSPAAKVMQAQIDRAHRMIDDLKRCHVQRVLGKTMQQIKASGVNAEQFQQAVRAHVQNSSDLASYSDEFCSAATQQWFHDDSSVQTLRNTLKDAKLREQQEADGVVWGDSTGDETKKARKQLKERRESLAPVAHKPKFTPPPLQQQGSTFFKLKSQRNKWEKKRGSIFAGAPLMTQQQADAVLDPSSMPSVPWQDLVDKTNLPSFVVMAKREQYLSTDEFKKVMGCTKEKFNKMPKWKQSKAKKKASLF